MIVSLPGVDQIGVFLALVRIRAHAQHAVFRLHHHFDARRQKIRNQRRQADAEIDVIAVAHFLRHAARDDFAFVYLRRHVSSYA